MTLPIVDGELLVDKQIEVLIVLVVAVVLVKQVLVVTVDKQVEMD